MEINFSLNAIETITVFLGWMLIGFFAYRINKKQTAKPKVWKIVTVILVGLFAFSIHWIMFGTIIKLPILPLGVWMLYFVLKKNKERWQAYRSYAWLGFAANFIFIAMSFITIPVHHAIYPKDKLSVYISDVEHASIINIHPSAEERSLNKDSLRKQLDTMRHETIYSERWYNENYIITEPNKREERFPYQLVGTAPKWGSGHHTIIYIEDDGKGILLSTPKEQFYFRSEHALIEERE